MKEPGPGSVINGFLASNCVGCANYRPKRSSGRPFHGEYVFQQRSWDDLLKAPRPRQAVTTASWGLAASCAPGWREHPLRGPSGLPKGGRWGLVPGALPELKPSSRSVAGSGRAYRGKRNGCGRLHPRRPRRTSLLSGRRWGVPEAWAWPEGQFRGWRPGTRLSRRPPRARRYAASRATLNEKQKNNVFAAFPLFPFEKSL